MYDVYFRDWKWVDGLIVDFVFLMNYLVIGGFGNCLVWDDMYGLFDVLCFMIMFFICEVFVIILLFLMLFLLMMLIIVLIISKV